MRERALPGTQSFLAGFKKWWLLVSGRFTDSCVRGGYYRSKPQSSPLEMASCSEPCVSLHNLGGSGEVLALCNPNPRAHNGTDRYIYITRKTICMPQTPKAESKEN